MPDNVREAYIAWLVSASPGGEWLAAVEHLGRALGYPDPTPWGEWGEEGLSIVDEANRRRESP